MTTQLTKIKTNKNNQLSDNPFAFKSLDFMFDNYKQVPGYGVSFSVGENARQGDVFMIKVAEVPLELEGAVEKDVTDISTVIHTLKSSVGEKTVTGITLVEGEATGHHHRLIPMRGVSPDTIQLLGRVTNNDGAQQIFTVKLTRPTFLAHVNVNTGLLTKDHAPVLLQAGVWDITNQMRREVDSGKFRAVID